MPMVNDLGVFERLGITVGRTIAANIPGDDTALGAEIDPGHFLEVWTVARDHVGELGRWRVLEIIQDWQDVEDGLVFSRVGLATWPQGLDASVRAVLDRARSMDFDEMLEAAAEEDAARGHASVARADFDRRISRALSATRQRWGEGPSERELQRAAAAAADPDLAIDKFLFDWERARGNVQTKARDDIANVLGRMRQFPPDGLAPGQRVILALLPTTRPSQVYAYLEGLFDVPVERVIVAARRWHERFGAEPVQIHPGYATHLRVQRRPADLNEAWTLAREHYVIAWDTFALSGISVRDYAYALLESSDWYFKSKP
jgi:hypothetical protein